MAVAVQAPQRKQERDPLDTILKGLTIANSVYGIKEASDKAQLLASQREQEKQAQQFSQAAKKAELEKSGYNYDEESGQFSLADGVRDLQKRRELAEIAKLEADARNSGNAKGLDTLLKQYQLADAQRKSTEIEGPKALAASYGRRMEQADSIIKDLASKGFDRTNRLGAVINYLSPNSMKGTAVKQQDQAERNFINAILRRESGAAIAADEFASAEEQYFPRAGDTAEVLAQKEQNRAQAIAGLKAEAGDRAWQTVGTAPMPDIKDMRFKGLPSPGVNQAQAKTQVMKEHPQDIEALNWAKANRNDPKAKLILKANGL